MIYPLLISIVLSWIKVNLYFVTYKCVIQAPDMGTHLIVIHLLLW